MKKPDRIAISKQHHEILSNHLFPGDGLEAAAILLCSKSSDSRLLVKKVVLVPYETCSIRTPNRIAWPSSTVESAIDVAESEHLSIILIHSHPGGLFDFSDCDDQSDLQIIPCLYQAISEPNTSHGSAIMIPDGAIRARIYDEDMNFDPIESVICASDNIDLWSPSLTGHVEKQPMAFSTEMRQDMSKLTACIVGVSGTGSIVAEQLARMGIGKLILIDFDSMESKNLNRILNSTIEDASSSRLKTEVFASVVKRYRDDIDVECVNSTICGRDSILAAGDADLLFCCVDSLEGRQICDRVSASFLQPLFDVGVTIPTRQNTRGASVVADVLGRVDYIFPGRASLLDREVYSPESLRQEYLRKVAPEDFDNQVAEGYIKGVVDEAPSVITLNMRAASTVVMEFIARRYPFRHESNAQFDRVLFSIAESEEEYESHRTLGVSYTELIGRGLEEPLLGMLCFQECESKEEAA